MLEQRSFRRIKPIRPGLWMEILHGSSDVETEIEPDAERNMEENVDKSGSELT